MIEVEEALARLLHHATPITSFEDIPILDSIGRVLAEDVIAQFPLPPFAKSGMDGYAVRSSDLTTASHDKPSRLKVVGRIMAGDHFEKIEEASGTAVRIMTGAPIPEGYDAVIKQEDTDYGTDEVQVYKPCAPWENYSQIGEDIQKDKKVIERRTRLSSPHIGVLASMGIEKVCVLKPLRVGIISTGDELIRPGEALSFAKVYNSCGYTVAAFVKEAGAEVVFLDICSDEVLAVCKSIEERVESVDLLITTGAISVGERDVMPEVFEKLGTTQLFRRVNMKPGTPVLANVYKNKLIISLSGNPFAAFTNFHLFFYR